MKIWFVYRYHNGYFFLDADKMTEEEKDTFINLYSRKMEMVL